MKTGKKSMVFNLVLNRKRSLRGHRSLLSILLLLLCSAVTAGEEPARRTVLFFAGIEKYEQDDMDKLKYQAEDAYKLWKQFQLANPTRFDRSRSKLLVANNVENYTGGELPSAEEY